LIKKYEHNLNKNFAEHKNFGLSKCSKEWIFQIDADELLGPYLKSNLHDLLRSNSHVDLLVIPRVNIVKGITNEDIKNWNWSLNEKGYIQWPDYQTRLFKNKASIKWIGSVHERVEGFENYSVLPPDENWALIHTKDIDRQRKQNELYKTI
jgi:hypothetical protein